MPISHPARLPRPGRSCRGERHAPRNVSCVQSAASPRSTSAREQNVKISAPNCSYANRSAASSPATHRAATASSAASRLAGSARTTSRYRQRAHRDGGGRLWAGSRLARSECIGGVGSAVGQCHFVVVVLGRMRRIPHERSTRESEHQKAEFAEESHVTCIRVTTGSRRGR